MSDRKHVITLGIGSSPGRMIWFITTGFESGFTVDTSVTFSIIVPQDDLSVTVPEEQIAAATFYTQEDRVIEDGELRVTENGEQRVTESIATTANVYALFVPMDDYSVTVTEETK